MGAWFRPVRVGAPAHRMNSDGRVAYAVAGRVWSGGVGGSPEGVERARGLSRSTQPSQHSTGFVIVEVPFRWVRHPI